MRSSPYTDYRVVTVTREAYELVRDWWYPAEHCHTQSVNYGEASLLHWSITSHLRRSPRSASRAMREVAKMKPTQFMNLMSLINDERETNMSQMTVRDTARGLLGERFTQFTNLLPSEAAAKRFCSIMVQHAEDENLAKVLRNEVGQKSFVGAALQCAEFNLEPALGQAWLIPYGGVVQFQLGYKGMLELAYRSGHVARVDAQAVFANDKFEPLLGEGRVIHTPPRFGDRGEVEGFYAVAELVSGGSAVEMMSLEEAHAHAQQYSQTYGTKHSPWTTAFNEMAKKTVLKRLLKSLPASIQDSRLAFLGKDVVVLDDQQEVIDMGDAQILKSAQAPEFESAPSDEARAVITEYWNGDHESARKLEGELSKAQLKWVEGWCGRNLEEAA